MGYHQVENAVTAYATLQKLQESGIALDETLIRHGFARVSWPARFEVLQTNQPVIVDSAHNRDSAGKLRHTLDEYYPQQRVVLILGASEDKDIAGMFDELAERIDQVVATRSYHPRSMEPEQIAEVVREFHKPVRIVPEIPEALDEALRISSPDTVILAGGSIFLAAGVREAWLSRQYLNNNRI